MKFPKNATIGDIYRPAMKIQTEAEANAYLEDLIQWAVKEHGLDPIEARKIQLSNIGYFTGYYDAETAERVMRVFRTEHPIFGTTVPSAKEAFEIGKKRGELDRNES